MADIKLQVVAADGTVMNEASVAIADGDLPRVMNYVANQPQYNRVRKTDAEIAAERDAHFAKYADAMEVPAFRASEFKDSPASPDQALQNYGRAALNKLVADTNQWELQQAYEAKRQEAEASFNPVSAG